MSSHFGYNIVAYTVGCLQVRFKDMDGRFHKVIQSGLTDDLSSVLNHNHSFQLCAMCSLS